MSESHIEKDIFPGLMMPPFHYTCFTRFIGYSEDHSYNLHHCFQVMLGLSGVLHFELEKEKRQIHHNAGSIFVLGPGIRHRWKADAGKFCENFMFFCDGFDSQDFELGNFFNVKRPDVIWHFDLEPEDYSFYVNNFRELIRTHDSCNANIIHGLLYAFCGVISRKAKQIYNPLGAGKQHPALSRAIEKIQRDFREEISLEDLSRHCGLGPSRLSELFRESLGMSPMQYLYEYKIKKASQLLKYSDMNVSQVAEFLGFNSVHYFSRFFKKHSGISPSDLSFHKS